MEHVKILESSTEESLSIKEAVCMKSVVRNGRAPTHVLFVLDITSTSCAQKFRMTDWKVTCLR